MSVNTLEIFVSDIAAALATFNVMQIRRATTDAGPWTDLTGLVAEAATLLGSTVSPFAVVGATLQLQIDSQSQEDILFTGTNPLSVDSVASQINAFFTGVAADNGAGKLKLTSLLNGTQSKVYVVGGSAAADLGFVAGQRDIGLEENIDLVPGVSIYNFYDRDGGGADGTETFVYEARFYNEATHQASAWSDPFQAVPGTAVGADKLSVASIDLVDASGVSVANQDITFFPIWEPLVVEGKQVALIRQPVTVTTDNTGHAEITLVRGLKVKVVFEGTSLIREIQVPDAATFDLMALIATAPDPFNPVEPDYPTAPRRTL